MKYRVLENVKVKTSKGVLELLPGQVATLPHRVASKLLNEGRITSCDTVLEPISDEILDTLLFTTIRRTKKDYSKAVMDYTKDNHKDVSRRCTDTSVEVSRIYALCKEGKASLDDFKAVLEPYHNICVKAIQLYKKAYPANITDDGQACARCGRPGERYCLGLANPEAHPDKQYAWAMFCLQCEPYKE